MNAPDAEASPMTQEALRTDLARLVAEAAVEELPALIGRLEAAKATAWARLVAALGRNSPAAPNGNGRADLDQNLSVGEAAGRLGVSKDYLYRHAEKLPFTVRIGRKLLFSARGLEKWNTQKQRR
jgi:excisionase family DNA binding protein